MKIKQRKRAVVIKKFA